MTSTESPRVTSQDDKAVAILRRLDGPVRKSLRASELTAVQHAMPKTCLSHAILHENPSHERHLSLHMSQLQRRQHQYASSQDSSRKAFIDQQQRKHRTWKSQDENKAAAMNFPTLRHSTSACSDVMYKSPRYLSKADVDLPEGATRLMPYMSVRRERTEFLRCNDKTYMLRLPTVIISDCKKMDRYDTYCGKTMLDLGKPAQDDRFQKLTNSLSATARVTEDSAPLHGHLVTQIDKLPPMTRDGTMASDGHKGGTRSGNEHKRGTRSDDQHKAGTQPNNGHREGTIAGDAQSNAALHEEPHKLRREHADTNLKLKRNRTKADLKTSGVDDLRHKYGHLKSSYDGTKDNADGDGGSSSLPRTAHMTKAQSDKR